MIAAQDAIMNWVRRYLLPAMIWGYGFLSKLAILFAIAFIILSILVGIMIQFSTLSGLQLVIILGVITILISVIRWMIVREIITNRVMTRQSVGDQPVNQGKTGFREGWPEWMKQLPLLDFPPQNPAFQLIDQTALDALFKDADPEAVQRIKADMDFLDHELLRLFRDRDYEAKFQQNRYRKYQIGYMVLSAGATLLGAFLALALDDNPDLVPYLGFAETLIALMTTYLATISGREAPLPLWLTNRRKAENLRREYFRYLMNLKPYDNPDIDDYDRRRTLSMRAADINRGVFMESEENPQS